jgi:hypothetical protein
VVFRIDDTHPDNPSVASRQARPNAASPKLSLALSAAASKPAPPGPLDRRAGETPAAWVRGLRDGGLLDPWPACLPCEDDPLPLEIGIDEALRALAAPWAHPGQVAHVIRHYTRSRAYLAALAAPNARLHVLGGSSR